MSAPNPDGLDRLAKATRLHGAAWATPNAPLLVAAAGFLGAATVLHSEPASAFGRSLLATTCPAWAAMLLVSSRLWSPPGGEVELSPMGPGWRLRTNAFLAILLAVGAALAAARGDAYTAVAHGLALPLALPARDLGASKQLGMLIAITTLEPPAPGKLWRLVVPGVLLPLIALWTWFARRSAARALAALEGVPPPP